MLFILTGNVQTGKTRWLEAVVTDLAKQGVVCDGVLAPGVWRESVNAEGERQFEKLGINNRLLPSGEEIVFARRRDLAKAAGEWKAESQSTKAQLGWEMPEESIARVNAHFDDLMCGVEAGEEKLRSEAPQPSLRFSSPAKQAHFQSYLHFLIVDELGPLELLKGGGIYKAAELLDKGPTQQHLHALVIVREALVEQAKERFASVWLEIREIHPNEQGRNEIFHALGLQ